MKKLYLFALAATMALFSACSSSEDVVDTPQVPEVEEYVSPFGPDGTGYINVNINLPSRSSAGTTRAENTSNDQYDDGLPSEYAVNNAYLILFNSKNGGTPITEEANYLFHSAYDLSPYIKENEAPENDNVTAKIVKIQDNTSGATADLYALVLLNVNGYFGKNGDDWEYGPPAGSLTKMTATTKFSDLLAAKASQTTLLNATGFFMSNAVLATNAGNSSTNASKLLVKVDADGIYPSLAAAQTGSTYAVDVYVDKD